MYEEDLALNNLQWLMCHKTKPNFHFFCALTSFSFSLHILLVRPESSKSYKYEMKNWIKIKYFYQLIDILH